MIVAACSLAVLPPAAAAPVGSRERSGAEYQVKAAFLLKFLEFIEKPGSPDVREVCVLGATPFGDSLDRLAELRSARGADTNVVVLDSLDGAPRCDLLFVSRSEADRLEPVLRAARATGVVTVSDIEGFALRGGMIELVMEGRSIQFVINQSTARADGVEISSQLLALAKDVVSAEGER